MLFHCDREDKLPALLDDIVSQTESMSILPDLVDSQKQLETGTSVNNLVHAI